MFYLHKSTTLVIATGAVICAVLIGGVFSGRAQESTLLGTAQSFAVLGGTTVTNTGPTLVEGNLGVSPGTAVTGFPPGTVRSGAIHAADEVASQAQDDVTAAYIALEEDLACDEELTGQDLGGQTLLPGVYCFTSSAQLTGPLVLDASANPDGLFVFQIGSTLTTASNSTVQMIGGSVCNVYWQVGSSATLGTTTTFLGNILALTSITLNNGATIDGRALARNGAVTMDSNVVSAADCLSAEDESTTTPTEEDATATLTETPGDGTATPGDGTATPSMTETATPGDGTATPGNTATATPTDTPGSPPGGPGQPPETSTPAGTPTQTTTPSLTSTPTSTAPETATSTATASSTPTGVATGTPTTPATGTPESTMTQTPTSTLTSTPTATLPSVSFPNTGSGGLLSDSDSQFLATRTMAFSVAIVLLLTASLAVVIERRSRS